MSLGNNVRRIVLPVKFRYNYAKPTNEDLFSKDSISKYLKSESFKSIARGWFVYKAIRFDVFTNNADAILNWTHKVFGLSVTRWLLKKTIYGQFVAGEDKDEVLKRIKKLEQHKIKFFLSYAAEERNTEFKFEKIKMNILDCISIVIDSSDTDRITAIKISPLAPHDLMHKINSIIQAKHQLFLQMSRQQNGEYLNSISLQTFQHNMQKIHATLTSANIEDLFKQISGNQHKITARRWQDNLVSGSDVYNLLKRNFAEVTSEEKDQLAKFIQRIDEIGNACKANNVKVLVDAEQTYIQKFIHQIAVHHMMKKLNKTECIVYNTYQCLLKETEEQLKFDLEYANEENFIYGLKMVRGAYLVEERRLAREMAYPDPTNPTLEATTEMYHRVMDICMREVKRDRMRLMIATHNLDSVRRAIKQMKLLGISKGGGVIFGQILGE
eukprot:TRINITY_DN4625_c0_g1_i3.p1 TRINITY_DN4625_c0_g1~~TRINITY_DN4625_c0_g1_i3.p1  ORF type:complete len:440 (-),score=102.00 TRINITY_DN4625_c0_g1_i3:1583-2902(-)